MVFLYRFVFLMWLVFSVQFFLGIDFSRFGILPRTTSGLVGIVAAPLIHGSTSHIFSNTFPLLFLGWALFFFYENIAKRVFISCYFLTNILVWLFARPNLHIGASGLVYGIAFFLIFYGFFSKNFKSLLISVIVLFLYGGLVYGLFPNQPGISWESHLIGAVVGGSTAMSIARKKTARIP